MSNEHPNITDNKNPMANAMAMIDGFCRDTADNTIVLIANKLGQISCGHGLIRLKSSS